MYLMWQITLMGVLTINKDHLMMNIMSCSEEFQGISFFYNYETQKLTKVFT